MYSKTETEREREKGGERWGESKDNLAERIMTLELELWEGRGEEEEEEEEEEKGGKRREGRREDNAGEGWRNIC